MRAAALAVVVVAAAIGCRRAPVGGAGGRDASVPPADAAAARAIWRPAPGTSWQWQLTGTIDPSFDVTMYDVDLFDTPQAVIDRLRADGRVVICYVSAGSWEDWRTDAAAFPPATRGKPLADWPGERWLDVRSPAVRTALVARLELAVRKRCDGVEPDNVDGHTNDTGFPLTAADQLDFNRFLAAAAHARGLSIGLKNDLDQAAALEPFFDWALVESCWQYDECDLLAPFLRAGKAVFGTEYPPATAADVCPRANAANHDTLLKARDLDAARTACRDPARHSPEKSEAAR